MSAIQSKSPREFFNYASLEHSWSYSGKSLLLIRHLLNVLARSCPQTLIGVCPGKIKSTITHLKLFSILSVPFAVVDLIKAIQVTWDSLQKKQGEAAALGSLAVSIVAADIFDSLTTFVNSLLAVTQKPLEIFPEAALPVAFYIASAGTCVRSYKLLKAYSKKEMKTVKFESLALSANLLVLSALVLSKRTGASARSFSLMALGTAIRLYNIPPLKK